MTDPVVGLSVRREAIEPAPASNAQMSVIGLCGPMTKAANVLDADFAAAFPMDEPVLFGSNSAKARMIAPDSEMGVALRLINAQLGRLQVSAQCVVSRTAPGADEEAAIAGIVGSAAARTGLHALRYAGSHVGAIPRLIYPLKTSWQETESDANPVVAELASILDGIYAVAAVDAPGTDRDGDVAYRETVQSSRIMVTTPGVKLRDSAGAPITGGLGAAAVGLFVRRDAEHEGRPFRSVMNQPVYGIEAATRAIEFHLSDGSVEGQDLLAHQIGPLVRGESGDDFAIADGGFVFMGFENVGEDLVWRQIHKVRGRDFVELTAIRTIRTYLGKWNLTEQTIQAVVNTVRNILSKATGKKEILGYQCRFDPDENNPDDLRTGHIYVDTRFEEAPVFRRATLLSRPYAPALDATIESLIAAETL